MTQPSIDGYFNPAQRETLRRRDRVEFMQKQLKKRLVKAFFGISIIAILPIVFPVQRDFDLIHNATPFIAVVALVAFYVLVVLMTALSKRLRESERGERTVSRHTDALDFTNFLLGVFAFFTIVNAFFFSLASIAIDNSDSMLPTLAPGDQLIIRHVGITYERGDIVVARIDDATYYVKRIVGVPGDTIACVGHSLIITAAAGVMFTLEEPYLTNPSGTCSGLLEEGSTVELGPDEYFLLGDNRPVSSDSRDSDIGAIPKERLHGKIIFRTMPIGGFGRVD